MGSARAGQQTQLVGKLARRTWLLGPRTPRDRQLALTFATGWAATALGLWSAAMWFAWFSWDRVTEYVEGQGGSMVHYSAASKSPRPWQVVGCGLAIIIASVVALLWVRRATALHGAFKTAIVIYLLASAAPVGFVVTWTWETAQDPTEDGLFLIASFMMLVLGWVGLIFVLSIANGIAAGGMPVGAYPTVGPPD